MLNIVDIKKQLENQIVTPNFFIKLVAELSGNATSPKYILVLSGLTNEFEIYVERTKNRHGLYELNIPKYSNVVSSYISSIDIKDRNQFFDRVKILVEEYETFVYGKFNTTTVPF